MKLYYSPGACSLSPHIVLLEAGLPYKLEKVDLSAKKTASGLDYLKVNPKGYVPALELDKDQVLTEGPAIVQYLADLAPHKNLAPPAGSFARYRLQEWLNFISTELHKGFSPLFNPKAPEEWKTMTRELLGRRIQAAATQLESTNYLMGDAFSVADAYLFTILRWAGHAKVDLSPWPTLARYQDRVASRPQVHAALAEEGLL